jgi:serine protease Do
VTEVSDFRALVAQAGVGEEVPILLLRDGREQSLSVVLAERPDTPEPPAHRTASPRDPDLGFKFEDISDSLAENYELPIQEGVVVTAVDAGSPARRGGLREGDVILEVNRSQVGSKIQVEREMMRAQNLGKPVVFLVQRGTTTTYVSVRGEG